MLSDLESATNQVPGFQIDMQILEFKLARSKIEFVRGHVAEMQLVTNKRQLKWVNCHIDNYLWVEI